MGNSRSWKPGQRPAGAGRKKGVPNKITTTIRHVFEQTFLELQKRPRNRNKDGTYADGMASIALLDWAQDNPTEFYKLAARLVPHEISGPGGAAIPIGVSGSVTMYIPDNRRGLKPGNGG